MGPRAGLDALALLGLDRPAGSAVAVRTRLLHLPNVKLQDDPSVLNWEGFCRRVS